MTINSVAGRAFVSHGNCKLITRVMSPSAMREWPGFHFLVGRGQVFFSFFSIFAMTKRWYCVRLVLDEARFVQINK